MFANYIQNTTQIKYQETLFIFSTLYFLIGFFRFYFPIIETNFLFLINVIILILIFIILIIYSFKYTLSDSFFTFVTGLIIFYPICFVSNPVHAIIMGVTMHYTQYLYLTHKVFKGRHKDQIIQTSNSTYVLVISMYALVMAILSLFGKALTKY